MFVPKISVVIPVHNRSDYLKDCLQGLYKQSVNTNDLEIFIIDDASTQGGPKELAEVFKTNYIRNRECLGAGFCKNLGLLQAKGDNVLFLDSDVRFISNTTLATALYAITSLPNCGEVGGEALLDHEGQVRYVFGRNLDFRTGKSCCDYVPVSSSTKQNAFWIFDYIPTSNCMLRREIALTVMGFDDAYSCLGEDKDFGYRVSKVGLHNYVLKDSVVHHRFVQSGRLSSALQRQYRTQIRFFWRHFGLLETTKMLIRFSNDLFREQQRDFGKQTNNDQIIIEFGNYYRNEILGLIDSKNESSPYSLMNGLNRNIPFLKAVLWTIAHNKNLWLDGSSRLRDSINLSIDSIGY